MDTAAVLDSLQGLGVTIEVQGDRLRFWPQSAVGAELLDEMRLHKAELMALLTAPAAPARGHRLIGVEYPPIASPQPDPSIIAARVAMCSCGGARLLPELRNITGGVCWDCYLAENPSPTAAQESRSTAESMVDTSGGLVQ